MLQLTQRILLLLVVTLAQTTASVNPESVPKKGENKICVLQERRDAAIQGCIQPVDWTGGLDLVD